MERAFFSRFCSSTFMKSNKFCFQAHASRLSQSRTRFIFKAFAARILLLRHGFSCQAIFSEPQIIRPTVSKTTNDQLSTRNFWTVINLWEHRNIKPQIISTTLNFNPQKAHLMGSKFQTPNIINLTYLECQTQNKHMSSPSSQS